MVYQYLAHISTSRTFLTFPLPLLQDAFSSLFIMSIQTQEARIILAIEAIRTSKKLSRRKATTIYNIPEATLRDRMNGRTPFNERRPGVQKLSELEKEVIVRNILKLDSRGFAPRLAGVEDIANFIVESRGGRRVGKL